MGWQGSEEGVGPPTYCSPSISGAPVISSTSGPLNGNSCAAESERREAEIAYEKHSSPEAVKTFIIITNLQAPTEPAGAHAAKQALQLLGFHISPLCIRRLEGSFFAGQTQKKAYLLARILPLCLFLKTERGDEECVYVCISLCLSKKQKYLRVCARTPYLLSQQTDGDELLCSCSQQVHTLMYVCVVFVRYWMPSH